MRPFRFHNPTVLYYGEDQIERHLVSEVKQVGRRVLLVYGGGSIKRNGLYDKVMTLLTTGDIEVFELAGVEPNPRVTTVRRGIDICRAENIELILAVGGGSVLDCAKGIAMGAKYEGDVWDLYAKRGEVRAPGAIPLGTILTLSATGSEMNEGGVITNWETKEKIGSGSPYTYPRFSFCDARNTFTVPRDQTVYGICDMLAHCFEHYFHPTTNTTLQQHLIEAVMKTIVETAPSVLENPTDFDARETIMYCSTMVLNGMISMGIAGDWANHAMEHEVSAFYDIPHGGGLAILFPHWMDYVMDVNPSRFASLGVNVFGLNPAGKTVSDLAQQAISEVRGFFRAIGAPSRLADYGIGDELLDKMAQQSVRFGLIGNFKKLNQQDVYAIMKGAL